MSKLKVAVIIGSTRDTRFGPIPAVWILEQALKRPDLEVELVDLKDYDLPFFNERMSNLWGPSLDPNAVAWQKKIAEFDAYIVVTAEYNRSLTASLKNAFDQAYVEWNKKAIGFVGYGGIGAGRAIEHARTISIELQMTPVRSAVHIAAGDFIKVVHQRQPLKEIEQALLPSAKELLDQITWWGTALKAARLQDQSATAAA